MPGSPALHDHAGPVPAGPINDGGQRGHPVAADLRPDGRSRRAARVDGPRPGAIVSRPAEGVLDADAILSGPAAVAGHAAGYHRHRDDEPGGLERFPRNRRSCLGSNPAGLSHGGVLRRPGEPRKRDAPLPNHDPVRRLIAPRLRFSRLFKTAASLERLRTPFLHRLFSFTTRKKLISLVIWNFWMVLDKQQQDRVKSVAGKRLATWPLSRKRTAVGFPGFQAFPFFGFLPHAGSSSRSEYATQVARR
jgi:hypothetical protein